MHSKIGISNLSAVFSAPVMREREEKRVADADARILLETIKEKKDTLTLKESVEILNDLSYLVVPVDQN